MNSDLPLDGDIPEPAEGDTGVELEDVVGDDSILDPFDPTQIRVETRPSTIDLLLARIRETAINLTPDFQRQPGIWDNGAQSRLIESLLIRIPLPAFYIDGTDDDYWVVVDGLQRLTALKRFVIDQDLKLTGLEFLAQLKDKYFNDLPRNLQRRILETQVTLFLITRGTPEEFKFTIFRRINTGGKPLSPQEIRHALNQGKITKLLPVLALSPEFKRATENGVSPDRMDDRELVLRFLTFARTPATLYKRQDFDGFLNRSMKEMNQLADEELDQLSQSFKHAMYWAAEIFGRDAFRKRYAPQARRKPINKPLFEAWSVNLYLLEDPQLRRLKERRDLLITKFTELLNTDRTFDNAISQGTGDVGKVQYRFERIQQLIAEVLT